MRYRPVYRTAGRKKLRLIVANEAKKSGIRRSDCPYGDRRCHRIRNLTGPEDKKRARRYDSGNRPYYAGWHPIRRHKDAGELFTMPANIGGQFLHVDFLGALNFAYIPFLIALFVPDFFSTFGTVLGVGAKAGYLDEDGNLPGIDKCFKVDAVATSFGALFGMPSMTTYLESSAGVEAGGKTGLTVVFTSIFFGLA